jgi:hypothetical protein
VVVAVAGDAAAVAGRLAPRSLPVLGLAIGLALASAGCGRPPESAETSHPASAPAPEAGSTAGTAVDDTGMSGAESDAAGRDGGETGAESPGAGELVNRVRWTTASEVDNFGYHVYRGDTPEGPWTRITESPIAGAGTTDLTTRYEWTDDTFEPDHEYFYWVEAIAMDGSRERFTPILHAPPKPAPETAPGG